MSDRKIPSFITRALRPGSGKTGKSPVISPDASPDELRQRAGDALGPLLRGMLGLEGGAALSLSNAARCRRSSQVTFAEVDGEAILLDLASGHYYSLNATGTVVWQLFDGERDLGAIATLLSRRFQVDPVTVWEDLRALVLNLSSEKLVTVEAPTDASM